MNNNNFGNKPSFGNSPFSNNSGNSTRSSFGSNQRSQPFGQSGNSRSIAPYRSSFGSSYGSSYGRPMSFGSQYGNSRPGGFGSYSRPGSSFGGSQRSSFGGFGNYQNSSMYRPSYMSTRMPQGMPSYANRFTPVSGSRYGYDSLPPFQAGNPAANPAPQQDVYNKYSLENSQPQGVDVNNNFERVDSNQPVDAANHYEQPNVEQQPVYDETAQYAEEQPVVNNSPDFELSTELLKNWEPSVMALAEYSSVGSEQRGSYIIDDYGNLVGEGYEGKQEDPNNPGAEVYEYSSEINAVNNAYSTGKENDIYNANILTSSLPSEESATYLNQLGIKAIYFWVKGEKAFKKIHKLKEFKKLKKVLEPVNCKIIPVLGDK